MNLNEKLQGVVREVSFKVSPHNSQPVNGVVRKIDYSNLTLAEVLALADSTVIIRMQRTLRSQKPEDIKAKQGAVVDAGDAGKAGDTPASLIAKLRALGLSAEDIAKLASPPQEEEQQQEEGN